AEGATVPANEIVAVLDDQGIRARLRARREEVAVLEAQLRNQDERIGLVESTWEREVEARAAEVERAESAADLTEKTLAREKELAETGASTAQRLDEARSQRDQAQSGLRRAREMLARAKAQERNITLARGEMEALGRRRELALAQLAELEVTAAKYSIRAPAVDTVVQTRFAWPGELAQPGTAILSVIDPEDKYVQIYLPVADLDRVAVGNRVEVELDSHPGARIPGEISFIADRASFTPEKIETRSDRLGQVYRAKVRVLDGASCLKPGTEGNVYLVEDSRDARRAEAEP
ncbi:MAG: HlyD family secretion protein, partial [Candidatus Binatia bacterium]